MICIHKLLEDIHCYEEILVDAMTIKEVVPCYYFGDKMKVIYKDGTSDIINKITIK